MAEYTYERLAKDIAELTAGQRRQPVRFLEPYDEAACLAGASLAVATAPAKDGDGNVLLDEGQVYLQS